MGTEYPLTLEFLCGRSGVRVKVLSADAFRRAVLVDLQRQVCAAAEDRVAVEALAASRARLRQLLEESETRHVRARTMEAAFDAVDFCW
eukprot:CAMPEP_0185183758 /NCGR_PEP_ID=MMETSP1140-20130426/2160_1 /TAXON_ID=298111 /ORGANISM="Pavlova sp., Strain CCMP459" /LENGTH=88 /DNA_ID=CAMNT_0027749783 /DNA_START=11 /DNA_END=274 /DNA_ORIENTATION=+